MSSSSLPVSRAAYLVERWLGYALIGLGIVLVCTALTLFGVAGLGVDAQVDRLFLSIINLYPGMLLVMTVTCLLATVLRRRAVAIGLSAAFVVASYVFNVIGAAASGFVADLMRQLSFFSYTQGEEIILGAHDPSRTLALLAVVLIGFALSIRMFEGRDIGLIGDCKMIGSVFLETFKQTWKQMVYWGVGLAAMAMLVVLMVPLFDMQQMKELLASFPPVILAMIGVGKELDIFATNAGFVAIGFFGKSALIFAVYPVVMGMRITANEEDSGIMDVVLSLARSGRARVVIEKFLAYGVSIVGVVVLIYLGLYAGAALGGVELNVARLAEVTFYLIPLMVFVMAVTMFIAVIVRRRQVALGHYHRICDRQLYAADYRHGSRRHCG